MTSVTFTEQLHFKNCDMRCLCFVFLSITLLCFEFLHLLNLKPLYLIFVEFFLKQFEIFGLFVSCRSFSCVNTLNLLGCFFHVGHFHVSTFWNFMSVCFMSVIFMHQHFGNVCLLVSCRSFSCLNILKNFVC